MTLDLLIEEQVSEDKILKIRADKDYNRIVLSIFENEKTLGSYRFDKEGFYYTSLLYSKKPRAGVAKILIHKAFEFFERLAKKQGEPITHKEEFHGDGFFIRNYFIRSGYTSYTDKRKTSCCVKTYTP